MSWWQRSNEEPGSVHFCTWAVDSEGRCLRASCIADRLRAELANNDQAMHELNDELRRAEAAIARVRELCAQDIQGGDYLSQHMARNVLRALDGGTE